MERQWQTADMVLRVASRLVADIEVGLAERGFDDVRPAHGFAFVRISAGDATTADVATHLGVTKQAAGQLVEQLVRRGYVTRRPDPRDARARVLALTDRGGACTRAAQDAAATAVSGWETELGPDGLEALHAALAVLAVPGPLRPAW